MKVGYGTYDFSGNWTAISAVRNDIVGIIKHITYILGSNGTWNHHDRQERLMQTKRPFSA
ncbi:hypothetical protein EDD64_13445 [Effusibacillus lacus]|nr:hypothetical protein EDD64_13445 [Effusibacillus lacus]